MLLLLPQFWSVNRPDVDDLRNKFVFVLTRTSDQSAATLNATVAAEGYPSEDNLAFVAGCGLSGKCSGGDSTASWAALAHVKPPPKKDHVVYRLEQD